MVKGKPKKEKKQASHEKKQAPAKNEEKETPAKKIKEESAEKAEKECCQDVDVSKYDYKKTAWRNKPFYTKKIFTIFHVPINIEPAITDAMEEMKGKGYRCSDEFMLMQKETGWLSSNLYFSIDNPEKGDPNVERITGEFVSKGFVGPYNKLFEPVKDLMQHLRKKGLESKELYMWYVNCPKCAKKQGGLKTILLARLK